MDQFQRLEGKRQNNFWRCKAERYVHTGLGEQVKSFSKHCVPKDWSFLDVCIATSDI